MQMQSRGNPHRQMVGQIQNRSTPNLPNLFQEGRNGCGLRALHDWRNSPKVQRFRELIRYRIVITLLSNNYNAPSQLSIYLENLLLNEALSEAEYMNMETLNARLQNIFQLMLNDQDAPKNFQSIPYDARKPATIVDLSYDHVNSTGNDLNYSCYEAISYSEHGTFLNYINQFDGNGRQESFSPTTKRRPDNFFSNSINCDSSSGCLDDIFLPLKRQKLQTSLFSCPRAVQPSTSQSFPELPQQHNSLVILNGEVSVVDTKASADFTRVSMGTHDVGNNWSDNYLRMNEKTTQIPYEKFIIDKDAEQIAYPRKFCKIWDNVEKGSDMEMESQVNTELRLGMKENLNNYISLKCWTEQEQHYDSTSVSSKEFIIDNDPPKIECPSKTRKTWENVDEDYIYFDSSNFNLINVGMNVESVAETEFNLGMLENLSNYTFTSNCKTWENKENYSICSVSANVASKDEDMDVEDPIGNESELEKFNNCTALEADHEKEHNYGTMPTPSKKSFIDEDSQKIMCSTILCKTWKNMKKGSICDDDSSCDISFNESMEVRNVMHEDLNKCSVPKVDHDKIQNLEKIKMSGVSLAEFFTEDEVRRHISSLKQSDSLSAQQNTEDIHLNGCDLCSIDKLYFAPVPLYCSNCASRIKHHGHYFSTTEENNLQHYLCLSCHKLAVRKKGNLPKMTMEAKNMCKKKNDEETAESWVQCDKCERWQHQICALYNHNKDLEGKATYTCPKCLLKDIQQREQRELKSRLVAKDLPTTMLSDHIENRLFCSLKKDRKQRAEMAGKRIDEVQGVEGLVVRVVSSVEKQLKVKKNFWDIFKKQNYLTEFPYRSKAIVVFQNIEGVDVCLFAMYIQEFGLECGPQNHRCVYISYLDSVKYFTPDTESGNGEALRSFVYHEIMIASLEFFKKRGFASCYLWACPPPKGEDYIFYCHPKNQKTPKSDKLRKWYQLMLRKAVKEGIVVNVTNLYDHFFVTSEVSNLKVTATRLPYFEGDYWTTAAEHIIKSLEKDGNGGSNIKGNKQVTKRTLRAMGHEKPSNCFIDDILLMQKLGENILSSKEDFMIVHLQFFCIRCDEAILSGKRWFCSICPNFQLCERCHNTTGLDTHTSINMETHKLFQVEVDIPFIKADEDVIVENSLFDDRQYFLDFCQKNRYQFDTLRRAKHSSMMILNDLHKQNLATVGKARGLLQLLQVAQHLSECIKRRDPGRCSTPHCVQMKKMFKHWLICTTHAGGGCSVCKKAVNLLLAHSRKCQNSECGIPHCKNLKKQHSSNYHSKLMPNDGTAVHSH